MEENKTSFCIDIEEESEQNKAQLFIDTPVYEEIVSEWERGRKYNGLIESKKVFAVLYKKHILYKYSILDSPPSWTIRIWKVCSHPKVSRSFWFGSTLEKCKRLL